MALKVAKLDRDPIWLIAHAGRVRQDEIIKTLAALHQIIPEDDCSLILDFTDALLPYIPGEHHHSFVEIFRHPGLFRLCFVVPDTIDHNLTRQLEDIATQAGIIHKVHYHPTRLEAEQYIRRELLEAAS
jgi:hypothetical protein